MWFLKKKRGANDEPPPPYTEHPNPGEVCVYSNFFSLPGSLFLV